MPDEILIDDAGAVRTVTLNRPHARNSFTTDTAAELEFALRNAGNDPDIHVVVLTGAGGSFSAGGDAHTILHRIASPDDTARLELMRSCHRLIEEIWNCRVPVISAVDGPAVGGGFSIALASDLVVCSPRATFSQMFLHRGIAPDLGSAWLLPRAVGRKRANEIVLTASVIDAERAVELGIANRVADDALVDAQELAETIASAPKLATTLSKRLLNGTADGDLHSALELEAVTQSLALLGSSAQAAFDGFLRKGKA
ncbi:enoyl-CoA hydratase/isomerase family protein [Gordonia sp. TBRC 11910]|uniref:Enoyl-CoA hydratase/isomerase family protein n=1 Tax=Gordonia asplenii TaxID=2725283 RepID=A0A848L7Q6_9ACTN|nr:enoyl-CoA hydratase/isomerase family protein [Gordonia asplenii]NMO03608.1 enoyl-CoA hydratase/isomerase family protein [Gordonia asplenii]